MAKGKSPKKHCGKWVSYHSDPGCTVSERCRRPAGHTGPCMGITVGQDRHDPATEELLNNLYDLGIKTLALVVKAWVAQDKEAGAGNDTEEYLTQIAQDIEEELKSCQ